MISKKFYLLVIVNLLMINLGLISNPLINNYLCCEKTLNVFLESYRDDCKCIPEDTNVRKTLLEIPDSLENDLYNNAIVNFLIEQKRGKSINDIELINRVLDTMDYDKGKGELMFPFTQFDSVVAYNTNCRLFDEKVQPCDYGSAFNIETKELKKQFPGKKVSAELVDSILNYINNPMNYLWGNCGCYASTSVFAFYQNNQIVAVIEFICGYIDTYFWPNNPRILYGGIIDSGIIDLLNSEGVFYGSDY